MPVNGLRTAKTKIVNCTHCGGANEVAARAMSVFCAHCRKRLILENYVIKSYQAVKGYATCGDVSVEKRGRVAAPIQSNSLTVKGKVNGKVEARGKVEVTSTGSLEGSLKATSLIVVQGAQFNGYCEIRPASTENVEAKPAEPAAPAPARSTSSNGVKKVSTSSTSSVSAVTTVKRASATTVAETDSEKTKAKPTKKVAKAPSTVKSVSTRKSASATSTAKKTTKKPASKSTKKDADAETGASKVKAISTRRKTAAASK